MAHEWLAMKDWESVTKQRRMDMLQRVVFGKIGPLPIKQVTPMHVLDVLTSAARQNGPSEAVEAHWSEFNLDAALWRIPSERTKQRKPHAVPLPRQAVELLRALHGVTSRWEHVFPGRDNHKQPMALASFRQALHGRGWSGKYSPHATRTTGSTRLNEMGYRLDWIERQLAHQEPNCVRRTYNHAEHFADRVVMMQRWADLLDEWEKAASEETHAEIVAMQPKAGAGSA